MEQQDQENRNQHEAAESQRKYEAALSQRTDPIGFEMHILQTTYKQLAQLDPKAKARVMTYLNAVMAERLN